MAGYGAGRVLLNDLEASATLARLQKGWQMDCITCQPRKMDGGLCEESQGTSRLSQQCSDRLVMPAIHWVWGVGSHFAILN